MQSVLPLLKLENELKLTAIIELVYLLCQEKGIINNDGKFTDFENDPEKIKSESRKRLRKDDGDGQVVRTNETKIFKGMVQIWFKICEIAEPWFEKPPVAKFNSAQDKVALAEWPESTRPDAVSVMTQTTMPINFPRNLIKSDTRPYLCDVAVLKEDKIEDKEKKRDDVRYNESFF